MNPKPSERIDSAMMMVTNAEAGAIHQIKNELDTLDTQHADLDRRVAALEAKPATAGEGWPRWTWNGSFVYRYDSPESCFFYRNGEWYETTLPRACNERDITHEQAIYFCPAIAKTHPLPTVKPPLTVEPVVKPDLTPEPASEPAPASVEAFAAWIEDKGSAVNLRLRGGNDDVYVGVDQGPDNTTKSRVLRRINEVANAFAARAVASEKARAAAAEKRVAELTEQRDELSATVENFHALIDKAQNQPKGTTSMDSLDTRIENLVKEKDRRVYYQNIVYSVCNSLDHINRTIGIMGDLGYTSSTVVCGTVDSPSDQVQKLMREVEKRIDAQKQSILKLDAAEKRVAELEESCARSWRKSQDEWQLRANAAERRAAELEKAIDGTCAHLAASESEVRRLRALIDEWAANANKLIVQKSDGLPKGAVR